MSDPNYSFIRWEAMTLKNGIKLWVEFENGVITPRSQILINEAEMGMTDDLDKLARLLGVFDDE